MRTFRFTADDARFMRRALALAARARGYVEPNPVVGAVVVRDGKVIGEGYHRAFGGPHAEVFALRGAGEGAAGATVYVTLEPCSHFGKTPPCADALIAAGVARVVAALVDPFPEVSGRGLAKLRRAGIRVDVGLLASEARELNAPFLKRVATGKPYVIAKWGQTLDGCIATATGESKWITSEASRGRVQILRGRVDAIAVGIGTALADDPLLIARPPRPADLRRIATRVVFDSSCRLPTTSQLVATVDRAPVMLFHAARLSGAAEVRRRVLASRGVSTVALPLQKRGGQSPALSIAAALAHLGRSDCSTVLVEGGPDLLAGFLSAGEVDEAHIFIAPTLIGGRNARHAVGGADLGRLANAHRVTIGSVSRSGPDLYVIARSAAAV